MNVPAPPNALDRLIDRVATLQMQVQDLQGEVQALRTLLREREDEALALRVMLAEWPVRAPDQVGRPH